MRNYTLLLLGISSLFVISTSAAHWQPVQECQKGCSDSNLLINKHYCYDEVSNVVEDDLCPQPRPDDEIVVDRVCSNFETCKWTLKKSCDDQCPSRAGKEDRTIPIPDKASQPNVSKLPIHCLSSENVDISPICDNAGIPRPKTMYCEKVSTSLPVCTTIIYQWEYGCKAHCGNKGVSTNTCLGYIYEVVDPTAPEPNPIDMVPDAGPTDCGSEGMKLGFCEFPRANDTCLAGKCVPDESIPPVNDAWEYMCDCLPDTTGTTGAYCGEWFLPTGVDITDKQSGKKAENIMAGTKLNIIATTNPSAVATFTYFVSSVPKGTSEVSEDIWIYEGNSSFEYSFPIDTIPGEYTIRAVAMYGGGSSYYTATASIRITGDCAKLNCNSVGGTCDAETNTCNCKEGYSGEGCYENVCGCMTGACNLQSLKCICTNGLYEGQYCQHLKSCYDTIECVLDNASLIRVEGLCSCVCHDLWEGSTCSKCNMKCANNGVGNNLCNGCTSCSAGFGGELCHCRSGKITFALSMPELISPSDLLTLSSTIENEITKILDPRSEAKATIYSNQKTVVLGTFINVEVVVTAECDDDFSEMLLQPTRMSSVSKRSLMNDVPPMVDLQSIMNHIIKNLLDDTSALRQSPVLTTNTFYLEKGVGATDGKCTTGSSTCFPNTTADAGIIPDDPVTPEEKEPSGNNTGMIVGIAVGGVVLIGIIVIVIVCCRRKSDKKADNNDLEMAPTTA